MIIYRVRARRLRSDSLDNLRPRWLIALLATAFVVTIIALGASIRTTAMAAPLQVEAPNLWAKVADGGGAREGLNASAHLVSRKTSTVLQANSRTEDVEGPLPDCEAGFEAVWQANLTAGHASDVMTNFQGYMSGRLNPIGALDLDSFFYDGQLFVIENLIFQQMLEGTSQLVLNTNQRLPSDLVFQENGWEFPIDDSMILGANNNIHVWKTKTPLDWSEGETFKVTLWRILDSSPQELPQYAGPDPLDSLPERTHVDGASTEGESHTGDITVSSQFRF